VIPFGAGIVLLGAFSLILLGLRRRVSASHRDELERLGSAAVVNDSQGHQAGDERLTSLADTLRKSFAAQIAPIASAATSSR
jgi:hypothetical protein